MSSFEVTFDRPPPTLVQDATNISNPTTLQFDVDRCVIMEKLKSNLEKAIKCMKMQADGKRLDIKFKVGDRVFVKLQNTRKILSPPTAPINWIVATSDSSR